MNAPRDLGPDFRAWLRDTPPMPGELPKRTLDQTRHTRQRRRWLWFLPGPKPTAGAEDRQDRAEPPASLTKPRGLLPAPIGGTTTMLSATKLVGLAAVAALAGSMLLTLPLNVQQDVSPPAATVDVPAEITPLSGTGTVVNQDAVGSREQQPWGFTVVDDTWTSRIETNDERLNGLQQSFHNRNNITPSQYAAQSLTVYLENVGGSWVGTGYAYQDPETSGLHYRMVLVGQAGYAGLTALMDWDQGGFSTRFDLSGVIISPGLPPMPDTAPTTVGPVPSE